MIILGIDPGTAITGYGVIEKAAGLKSKNGLRYIECGCIRTSPSFSDAERLVILQQGLLRILKKHKPDVLAIEKLYFFKNLKTAMPVSQAKGVILLEAAKKKIPILEFTPPQVKISVTGFGRAEKKQVQYMVKMILGLKKIPKPDDAADALAVCICGSNFVK
jgi:crossover junction endodeoxyribonuclease RuvC